MMSYAQGTTVSSEKSRGEIEQMVQKYAGRDADFTYGKMGGQAAIAFVARGRRVQFSIPMPTREEADTEARDKRAPRLKPTPARIEAWLEQETRRRWRCLLLIIKAKFAAVEIAEELGGDNAENAFEREFLSHIEARNGQTIWAAIQTAAVNGQRLLTPVEDVAKVVNIK